MMPILPKVRGCPKNECTEVKRKMHILFDVIGKILVGSLVAQ